MYVYNDSKSSVKKITVAASGKLRELNIDKAEWGKPSNCKGVIGTSIAPGKEKVFVIE